MNPFTKLSINESIFGFEDHPVSFSHVRQKLSPPFFFNHFNCLTAVATLNPCGNLEQQGIVLFAILCECVFRAIGTGKKSIFDTTRLYLTFFVSGEFRRINPAAFAFTGCK
jgi:hypothetical protein